MCCSQLGSLNIIFLFFPDELLLTTSAWVVVLAITVVARSMLAWRILRPVSRVKDNASGNVPGNASGDVPGDVPGDVSGESWEEFDN